jgi:uncharacterized protein YjbJ (UPF0337 family)
MDPKRIEGMADKLKGSVKQGIGKLTGRADMKAEGAIDKAKGRIKGAAGRVEDEVRAEEHRRHEDDRTL